MGLKEDHTATGAIWFLTICKSNSTLSRVANNQASREKLQGIVVIKYVEQTNDAGNRS